MGSKSTFSGFNSGSLPTFVDIVDVLPSLRTEDGADAWDSWRHVFDEVECEIVAPSTDAIDNAKKLELNKAYLDRIELLEKVLLKLSVMDKLAEVQSIKERYLLTGRLTRDDMELMNGLYAQYYKELRKRPDATNIFIDISNRLNPLKG